jgi:hypothetical protein
VQVLNLADLQGGKDLCLTHVHWPAHITRTGSAEPSQHSDGVPGKLPAMHDAASDDGAEDMMQPEGGSATNRCDDDAWAARPKLSSPVRLSTRACIANRSSMLVRVRIGGALWANSPE